MDSFFLPPLATSTDLNGLEFVALLESRHYTMWAAQFHPEKPAFELSSRFDLPRSRAALRANAFFAEFFVDVAKTNGHGFQSAMEEEGALIYNHKPEFVGKSDVGYSASQSYLFKV